MPYIRTILLAIFSNLILSQLSRPQALLKTKVSTARLFKST